jgi:hypothetical protein
VPVGRLPNWPVVTRRRSATTSSCATPDWTRANVPADHAP